MIDLNSALLPLPHLLAASLVFALAGMVKGLVGMGLPAIAMGLLCLILPPAQAAGLLIIPAMVTNLWQLAKGPPIWPLIRRLWSLQLGLCLGVTAGAALPFFGLGQPGARHALGGLLACYALLGLSRWAPRIAPGREWWLSPIMGGLTGLIAAQTGVFVLPTAPYLQAMRLERDELVQALGLTFTVASVALALLLTHQDGGSSWLDLNAALMVPVTVAGMAAGHWLRQRISPDLFRRLFLTGLFCLGAFLALA